MVHSSQLKVSLTMEAIMNLKNHHTTQELKTLYRTERDVRYSLRIHGISLAAGGLSCTQIMSITSIFCDSIS